LPVPPGPSKQCIFAPADEGACGQVEYQAAIHLGIEVEVEVVKRLLRIAEGGLLAPPLQQAVAAPGQLVGDQATPVLRDRLPASAAYIIGENSLQFHRRPEPSLSDYA
jgi:hypothetical protein